MRTFKLSLVSVVLAGGIALGAGPAQAADMIIKDKSEHERAQTLDAVAILGFLFGAYTHVGAAVWYGYPIVPEGFLPELNEAFYIEAGAALERYSWDWGGFGYSCSYTWNRLTPMGGVRWAFYLTDDWTVFATGKLGFGVGFGDSYECGGYTGTVTGVADYSDFALDLGAGAYWNFSENWSVRLDLSYFGATVGAGTKL